MSLHRSLPDPARGVFETFLVRDGRPVELEAHLARLTSSVTALYTQSIPHDVEEMVTDRARSLRLGRLRLAVAPNGHAALATDVAEAQGGDSLPLVVDGHGSVLEASRANVFVVEGETIVTPPTDGRILAGVTRRRVLEFMPVREEAEATITPLVSDGLRRCWERAK